jgi:hypothetical protein
MRCMYYFHFIFISKLHLKQQIYIFETKHPYEKTKDY